MLGWEKEQRVSPSTKERRYPRIDLPRGMSVAWQCSGKRATSRVVTLGLGGLYANAPDPPSVGDLIQVLFDIPGGEVRAGAMVRDSHSGKGMGIEFVAMSPEARGRLHNLMEKLSTNGTSAKRRSTRVFQDVFLTVTGVDASGQPFVEKTATVYLSLHGCSYLSRHAGVKMSRVSLEVLPQEAGAPPRALRARVVWNGGFKNLPGVSHVGVEFESPGNVWGLAEPPEDWRQENTFAEPIATAFEAEMKTLLAIANSGTYYQLLGVTPDSPLSEVRHHYYELVRKCHPDRHMDHPELMQILQKLMHSVNLAYKTLADNIVRENYDRGLVASGAFALGLAKSELQHTSEESVKEAQKCYRARNYGGAILWMRKAVDIEPTSSRYRTLLARSLSAVSIYRREAIEHLEKAIDLDSLNAAAHFHLAELYEQMELPWRSTQLYRKILEIEPGNNKARERLRTLELENQKSGAGKRAFLDHIFGRSFK